MQLHYIEHKLSSEDSTIEKALFSARQLHYSIDVKRNRGCPRKHVGTPVIDCTAMAHFFHIHGYIMMFVTPKPLFFIMPSVTAAVSCTSLARGLVIR